MEITLQGKIAGYIRYVNDPAGIGLGIYIQLEDQQGH